MQLIEKEEFKKRWLRERDEKQNKFLEEEDIL